MAARPSSAAPPAVDVVVIGAGPAGLSLARALGDQQLSVMCVDPKLHAPWPNNYGAWHDELEPLGLADCSARTWGASTVFTGDGDEKTVLPRAYMRIDREKLKSRLWSACEATGRVTFLEGGATEIDTRSREYSVVRIDADGNAIRTRASAVVDCTGPAVRFTELENMQSAPDIAYQAAYGIEAELEDDLVAYDQDEMLLMDYRDAHMQGSAADRAESDAAPAFLYVFPMGPRRAFFEETSLIADQAVSFESLERRLYLRLAHHGVRVRAVHEVEYSLIPMGGALPERQQRTLAFGASAGFVHPATGYSVAHTLARAQPTAVAMAAAIASRPRDADALAAMMWAAIWPASARRHRAFLQFGADVLRALDLAATRHFFAAFFRLHHKTWFDFLAGGLDSPGERLGFALAVFWYTSNRVRVKLISDALGHGGAAFFLSVLPLPTFDADVSKMLGEVEMPVAKLKSDATRLREQTT